MKRLPEVKTRLWSCRGPRVIYVFVNLNLNVAYNNSVKGTCCDPRMRDNAAVAIRSVAMGTQSAKQFYLHHRRSTCQWGSTLDSLSVVTTKVLLGCMGNIFLSL